MQGGEIECYWALREAESALAWAVSAVGLPLIAEECTLIAEVHPGEAMDNTPGTSPTDGR
jgi:hypothetical protein